MKEVIIIENENSRELALKARVFLQSIKPYLKTGECVFASSFKNRETDLRFNLKHDKKVEILSELTEGNCFKIDRNDNPRYSDSEVYFFLKEALLFEYGEEKTVTLYIKMYLAEKGSDPVIVISFHEEGMID